MMRLNLAIEKKIWKKNYLVVGIDEVGRGSLAGPLTIASICYSPTISLSSDKERFFIRDSKKTSPKKREELALWIKKNCLFFSLVNISQTIIDKYGIVYAFEKGVEAVIKKTIKKTNRQKLAVFIDGFLVKKINSIFKNKVVFQQALIKGDDRCFSIASASIVAKVHRDRLMTRLAKKYPHYHLDKNKGYGTKEHFQALRRYGLAKIHRRSYLRKFLDIRRLSFFHNEPSDNDYSDNEP